MLAALLLPTVLLSGHAGDRAVLALATDVESVSQTIAADVLEPPLTVRCSGGLLVCTAGLLARPVLTWTPTVDTYATGYTIHRSTTSGSGYVQIASIAGRTTSTWTDNTTGLSTASTYFYVVRAAAPVWTSANSNQVMVTIVLEP